MLITLVSSAFALCESPEATMIPADGAVDVPVDVAVLWSTNFSNDDVDPVLTDADGVVVPVVVAWFETPGYERYAVLTPAAPLSPGVVYTVADERVSHAFTTGEAGSSAAPDVPVVAAVEAEADRATETWCSSGATSWEEHREHVFVDMLVEEPTDGHLEARVRVDGGEESFVRGRGDGIRLAWGGCSSSNLPDMEGAREIRVALRSVSYDGQVSDWGEERTVEVPWPEEPCAELEEGTCATGPRAAWAGGIVAALLALGGRARRR